jgi:hypothetical protein
LAHLCQSARTVCNAYGTSETRFLNGNQLPAVNRHPHRIESALTLRGRIRLERGCCGQSQNETNSTTGASR